MLMCIERVIYIDYTSATITMTEKFGRIK